MDASLGHTRDRGIQRDAPARDPEYCAIYVKHPCGNPVHMAAIYIAYGICRDNIFQLANFLDLGLGLGIFNSSCPYSRALAPPEISDWVRVFNLYSPASCVTGIEPRPLPRPILSLGLSPRLHEEVVV